MVSPGASRRPAIHSCSRRTALRRLRHAATQSRGYNVTCETILKPVKTRGLWDSCSRLTVLRRLWHAATQSRGYNMSCETILELVKTKGLRTLFSRLTVLRRLRHAATEGRDDKTSCCNSCNPVIFYTGLPSNPKFLRYLVGVMRKR